MVNGSQQQFLVRDSSIGGWSNGMWNQVFAGVQGAPAQAFPPVPPEPGPYTTLATNPASREKPYLVFDPSTSGYSVFVPDPRTSSSGTTWAKGQTPGHSIALSDFYVARPSDSATNINSQLARGKNLLLTPGVYNVDRTIAVKRADTIVLGLGVATLTAMNGVIPLSVADVKGVDVAGIMIDAGAINSPVLLRVGSPRDGRWRDNGHFSSPSDPTALQDVYFRIGGPHPGKATIALQVNSDNVILDDIWAWRADDGAGVGWTANTSDTAVVVNGRNVTATGLFSEHFQKYNVIWNGEHGKTIFFPNELPYDAPNQAAWQHDGVLGWAGCKVADSVRTHELWGGGSYIYDHVINDTGAPVSSSAIGVPSYVADFSRSRRRWRSRGQAGSQGSSRSNETGLSGTTTVGRCCRCARWAATEPPKNSCRVPRTVAARVPTTIIAASSTSPRRPSARAGSPARARVDHSIFSCSRILVSCAWSFGGMPWSVASPRSVSIGMEVTEPSADSVIT